jgi:uncharacterized protein
MLKMTYGIILTVTMVLAGGMAYAENVPTIDQVYQAAHAGRLDDAQRMMASVLKAHPNSPKAHFVAAELSGKQGQMSRAETELNIAQQLQPDLSFAKPQAVQDLKNRIAASHTVSRPFSSSSQAEPASSIPWGLILLGLGVIALITMFMRKMGAPNSAGYPGNYQPGMQGAAASPVPMQPYGGGMAASGGGLGGGIMGGLATGAAVGVGMVAGEALAHHFMDGGQSAANNVAPVADTWGSSSDDMGGSDFGLASNSSWDDNSGIADNGADVSGGDWG